MPEIIPSINVPTFPEVQERIKKVEPYVAWCHLDITDGMFSEHPTWREPADLVRLETSLKVEAHLMIEDPEKVIDRWLVHPIRRIITHLEAISDHELIIKKCRDAQIEIGFAIKPDTFWGMLGRWFQKVDLFVLLTVTPGPSGQRMSKDTYEKIAYLRAAHPPCLIEIDGDMNISTISKTRESGANLFVVGSAIFSQQDIGRAIGDLRRAIGKTEYKNTI